MKQCGYFERLISDNLDRSLTVTELAELDAHIAACKSCASFSMHIVASRTTMQSLPVASTVRQAPQLAPGNADSFLSRFWSTRLTVPLPLAAGTLLLLLSAVLISALVGRREAPITEPDRSAQANYVQIEVVSPSTAKPLTIDDRKNGE